MSSGCPATCAPFSVPSVFFDVQQTDAAMRSRWSPAAIGVKATYTSASGTTVWTGRALQAESDDLELIGLALLYPALERNVWVPGHHGYPRASDLILGKA
jgi:hypothetical protein